MTAGNKEFLAVSNAFINGESFLNLNQESAFY
jgi:hypothetical protein